MLAAVWCFPQSLCHVASSPNLALALAPVFRVPPLAQPARRPADMSGAVAVKRFYERVGVRCAAKAEYLVTLDGRDLRTPAKKLLSVPTEGLAWAIASEWEAQPKQRIQPSLMPLMTLATTTIDQFPDIRANMTRSMLRAMESDAACLLSSDQPVRHRGLEP